MDRASRNLNNGVEHWYVNILDRGEMILIIQCSAHVRDATLFGLVLIYRVRSRCNFVARVAECALYFFILYLVVTATIFVRYFLNILRYNEILFKARLTVLTEIVINIYSFQRILENKDIAYEKLNFSWYK